jgi:hypothetical protein
MIEVLYRGRLGNNLFQYCLGRIFAEEFGLQLQAQPIPGFPNTADRVSGEQIEAPTQLLAGHRIDLAAIFADRTKRKIILDGWFQRHEYYRQYREKIRHWLTFDSTVKNPEAAPGVVMNIRRTDYVWRGWALPFSFYEDALNHLAPAPGEVWIVTDDRHDPFFRGFSRWKPRFYSGTPCEQLLFMTRASRLVMSPSTFSWWPSFLGNHEEIVCPDSTFGAWSKHGGAASDANLIERDRFTCLKCDSEYTPTNSEARYQSRRLFRRRVVLALNRRLCLALPDPPE